MDETDCVSYLEFKRKFNLTKIWESMYSQDIFHRYDFQFQMLTFKNLLFKMT